MVQAYKRAYDTLGKPLDSMVLSDTGEILWGHGVGHYCFGDSGPNQITFKQYIADMPELATGTWVFKTNWSITEAHTM